MGEHVQDADQGRTAEGDQHTRGRRVEAVGRDQRADRGGSSARTPPPPTTRSPASRPWRGAKGHAGKDDVRADGEDVSTLRAAAAVGAPQRPHDPHLERDRQAAGPEQDGSTRWGCPADILCGRRRDRAVPAGGPPRPALGSAGGQTLPRPGPGRGRRAAVGPHRSTRRTPEQTSTSAGSGRRRVGGGQNSPTSASLGDSDGARPAPAWSPDPRHSGAALPLARAHLDVVPARPAQRGPALRRGARRLPGAGAPST